MSTAQDFMQVLQTVRVLEINKFRWQRVQMGFAAVYGINGGAFILQNDFVIVSITKAC